MIDVQMAGVLLDHSFEFGHFVDGHMNFGHEMKPFRTSCK
jgi:hypothetical protein